MRRDELSAACRPSGTPQCRYEAGAWQREHARLASENQTSARVTLFPPTEGSWHPTSSPLLSTLLWTPSPPCPLCKGKGWCSSHGVYTNSHGCTQDVGPSREQEAVSAHTECMLCAWDPTGHYAHGHHSDTCVCALPNPCSSM